ncbi:MAG: nucleotidyltransferase domain-containing protein [Calditrichaceae bacterium]|nr:nucleotidyltransferase domain-containing protein [Calditrichia bacterium]NUQ42328.1 nucleotidyltransferase domain-containing protein [Calditrichaceae bacterium]
MSREEILGVLRQFKENNRTKYHIIKIGIFGSAAHDNMKSQSDIDVVVELEQQNLMNIIGIKQDLEEQFAISVDVVSYREKMNQFLKQRIDRDAIYV